MRVLNDGDFWLFIFQRTFYQLLGWFICASLGSSHSSFLIVCKASQQRSVSYILAVKQMSYFCLQKKKIMLYWKPLFSFSRWGRIFRVKMKFQMFYLMCLCHFSLWVLKQKKRNLFLWNLSWLSIWFFLFEDKDLKDEDKGQKKIRSWYGSWKNLIWAAKVLKWKRWIHCLEYAGKYIWIHEASTLPQ